MKTTKGSIWARGPRCEQHWTQSIVKRKGPQNNTNFCCEMIYSCILLFQVVWKVYNGALEDDAGCTVFIANTVHYGHSHACNINLL